MISDPARPPPKGAKRRLRTAGKVAAVGAGSGLLSACTGPSRSPGPGGGGKQLRILQWTHVVPSYDKWFDGFAKPWGEDNGLTMVVDHIDNAQLAARTAAEINANQGRPRAREG